MKNRTEKTKLSPSVEALTPGKESSFIVKNSVGGGDKQIRIQRTSHAEKEDAVFYLNHNLLLLEREVAFFNFAIQEITDLVS